MPTSYTPYLRCTKCGNVLLGHVNEDRDCYACLEKGSVVEVKAWTVHGQSGQYLVVPSTGRDDRPWQMRLC